MTIKDKLETHKRLLKKIRTSEQQLENLKEGVHLPAVSNPNRSAVQGGKRTDRLPGMLHQIEVIQKELENLYVLRGQEHEELWNITNLLDCNDKSVVLQSKYFNLMSREEIATLLFSNQDDFAQDRRRYMERVSKLHSYAIAALNKQLIA